MTSRQLNTPGSDRGSVLVWKTLLLLTISATLFVHSSGHGLKGRQHRYDGGRARLRRAAGDNNSTIDYGDGTTPNLREVFLGRCYDYECDYCSDDQSIEYECEALWAAFNNSFAYQPVCSTSEDDFADFINMSFISLPQHQTLFYSGLYTMAMTLGTTSPAFTNIELTLLGGLVDGVTFCSQPDAPGIGYDQCPSFGSCENETQAAFWAKSSQSFAGDASGDVTVLLDGSRDDGAYRTTSFFRTAEVPNMNPDRVTSLTAYVVHRLEGPIIESCGTGSLVTLQQDITDKGIEFRCVDDADVTRHIQCINEPEHELCIESCPGSATTTSGRSSLVLVALFTSIFYSWFMYLRSLSN